MIRDARESDVPLMIGMGRRFHEASGIGDLIEFDEVSFAHTAKGLIREGICLVPDDLSGMAGVALHRPWFNEHEIFAQELFWWVEPWARGSGGLLMDAIEKSVKERGASVLGMLCLDALRGEAVGKLYRRRGYRPVERAFMKRVG